MSKRKPHEIRRAANDNIGARQVICLLPERIDVVAGEAELVSRHLGDILALSVANDNDPDSDD